MNPITREEQLLQSVSDGISSGLSPITREEQYLSFIAGETSGYPQKAITRKEQLLEKIAQGGTSGGGGSGGAPTQVSTASAMDSILANATDADLGKVYYYTGASTDTYEQGALYMITKEE